jgi:SAM-dependent methyltransferase
VKGAAPGRPLEAEAARSAESREAARELYAAWQPGEMFMREGRRRKAAAMLREAGCFPRAGEPCLEVGCGRLGWLADLLSWGLEETDLHGIEIDQQRLEEARRALPAADLRQGDAASLPWKDGAFRLVVVSTVFSSILEERLRKDVAAEIERVLAPGGVLLWYDFAVDSPRNPRVRGVPSRSVRGYFPRLAGRLARVTLAPPLARLLAPRLWPAAIALEALLPPLRTHRLAVLRKETAAP